MITKIFITGLLIIAAATLAKAQDGARSEAAPAPVVANVLLSKGSTVRGRVIYEDNGKPVRRGPVSLLKAENLTEDPERKTIARHDGSFVIKNVPAGTYYPSVDVAGVLNPANYSGFTGMHDGKVSARRMDLHFKKIVSDGINEVDIVILVKRAGVIMGRVTYFDGDAAPGLKVEALRKSPEWYEGGGYSDRESDLGSTVTDDRGIYRFSGLPPGEYIVFVQEKVVHTSDGLSYNDGGAQSELTTYFPSAETIADAGSLEILPGGHHENADISIPDRRLFSVSGKVVLKGQKNPVRGVRITFDRVIADNDRISSRYASPQTSTSGDDGIWMIGSLPAGKYRIEFNGSYSSPEGPARDEEARKSSGRVVHELTIEDSSQEGLIIEMPYASGISGTVLLEGNALPPETMFVLTMSKDQGGQYGYAHVPRSGEAKKLDFRITNAPPGENMMSVYTGQGSAYYVKSIRHGSNDLLAATLKVKEGEEISGVEIVLSDKPGILKGTVNGAGEEVLDYPRVVVIPVSTSEAAMRNSACSVIPDDNGEFECKLAPGDYFVFFYEKKPTGESWEAWYKRRTEGAMKTRLEKEKTTKIKIEMPKK